MEEKHEILINILKDVASNHPEIRDEIMKKLSDATSQGEVVIIDD
jgi:hypothetical protein